MDEHRLGLKPIRRRVWVLRGKTPLVWERARYRWLYVSTFVRPSTGENEHWLLPSVDTESFAAVLEAFARVRGAGRGRWGGWRRGALTSRPSTPLSGATPSSTGG